MGKPNRSGPSAAGLSVRETPWDELTEEEALAPFELARIASEYTGDPETQEFARNAAECARRAFRERQRSREAAHGEAAADAEAPA
jgi:hypothetical protein